MRGIASTLAITLTAIFLICVSRTPSLGIGLPAGTQFQVVARATYTDSTGAVYDSGPIGITLTVEQVAGVVIEAGNNPNPAVPGNDYYVPMRIVNIGNGIDSFALSSMSTSGWNTAIIYDDNADGIHQPTEQTVISVAGLMVADGYSPCFAKVSIPNNATSDDTILVQATSNYDPTKTGLAQFEINVPAAPNVVITSPSSEPSFTVSKPLLTLGGTVSGGLEILSVEWRTDKGASGTCSGTTNWIADDIPLTPGTTVITVTAADAAGRSASDSCTVTYLDTTPPTVTITKPTTQHTYTTDQPNITIEGNAQDDTQLASVTWTNSTNQTSGNCTGTQNWIASQIPLAQGDNNITITATDQAGNKAHASITITYTPQNNQTPDTTPPTVTITKPTTQPTYTTNQPNITIEGNAQDDTQIASVTWTNNTNQTSGNCTGTQNWIASQIPLAQGDNNITITATDQAGNKAHASITITYTPQNNQTPDTTPPTVTITKPTTQHTYTTNQPNITIEGNAQDDTQLASVTWTNNTNQASGNCTGTQNWIASQIPLAQGDNNITITATDQAGNTAQASITVIYDATSPEIQITSPTQETTCSRNCSFVRLVGICSDNRAVIEVTWQNQTTGASGTSILDYPEWISGDIELNPGENQIVVIARDKAGNTGTDHISVTYQDLFPGDEWRGLSMVSLPIIPDEVDPKLEVGFLGNYWLAYITDENAYVAYPDKLTWLQPAQETPGRGFWAYFGPDRPKPCGTIPAQDKPASIRLKKGWNLIGTPFVNPVKWSMSSLRVKTADGTIKLLRDATNIVTGYAWGWRPDPEDPRRGSYYLVYDSELLPGVEDQLLPWQAYWIKSNAECELIIPPPTQ